MCYPGLVITIFAVQSKLYRAKSLVDACVTIALTGATGNLGSNIFHALISACETVRALVRNPATARVHKEVYISSTGAIPEFPGNQPTVEVSNFEPDAVIGYYSKSKAAASQMVMAAVDKYDLNASIVQMYVILPRE